jgi:hypothetical protein
MEQETFIKYRPPIDKWYNVKKDAYQLIYSQAKERLEDVLSESESITNKSIKMITALAAFLGFFIGFVKQNHLEIGYQSVFFLFVLIDAILLYILVAPKEIKNRGLSPDRSIPKDLDADEDKDFQIELVYYQTIIVLQDNIDFMIYKNTGRATLYKWSLLLFLLIFAAVSTFIVMSL